MLKAQAFTGGNLFIDGIGLMGEVVEVELPKIEKETIETSSGIGKFEAVLPVVKPLNTKITVNNLNELYFKMLDSSKTQKLYLKANATNSNGEDEQVIATFEGKIKSLDGAKFEFNKEANLSFEVSLTFYKLEIAGSRVILYDALNHIFENDGVDMFLAIRKNIL